MHKKIFFIHVAKTAGSSFNRCLRDHFSGDVHCEKYFEPGSRIFRFPDRLRSFDFISGHLRISDFYANGLSRDDYFLMTFLRNPLDQLVSHVNWLLRIRELGEQFFKVHPLEIQEISHELHHLDLNEPEVLMGVLTRYSDLFKNNQSGHFLLESEDSIECVIKNISDLDFVGITEEYTESLKIFRQLTRIDLPLAIYRENKNIAYRLQAQTITQNKSLSEFVKEYNRLDFELYEYCSSSFSGQ